MKKDKEWARELLKAITAKELSVASRRGDRIPYTADNGVFDNWDSEDRICWWTNGFWAGMLWLLYDLSEEKLFRDVAEGIEKKLDRNLMKYMGMDHDSGFKWLLTSVANYKITRNEESKNRALLAAGNLAGRFNQSFGMIRAWNDSGTGETAGWVIIDCLMNLPLLYWASDVTNDPRFRQTAMLHADNAAGYFLREDGSVRHIIMFDSATGRYIKSLGGQGREHGSSWTRGQAWALYGFALSFSHTGKTAYLEAAQRVADYILSQLDESWIIPVDFCQEADKNWEDSTAAAIMACGFLQLYELACDEGGKERIRRSEEYYEAAIKLLKTLEKHSVNMDESVDFLVTNCSAAYNEKNYNYPIIYGDYFFTEALLKVCGGGIHLW